MSLKLKHSTTLKTKVLNKSAAHNSNLETVIVLSGATLDFAIIIFKMEYPSHSIRKYTSAAIALIEASAKPWISNEQLK